MFSNTFQKERMFVHLKHNILFLESEIIALFDSPPCFLDMNFNWFLVLVWLNNLHKINEGVAL